MPAVISDTSVIHYLATVDHTELLRQQFGNVLVPPALCAESAAWTPGRPGLAWSSRHTAGWLSVQSPKPVQLLKTLSAELDAGEAEAIVLACELKPAIILLDESEGRTEARRLGLTVIGTAGILLAAQRRGDLPRIKPILDRLIDEHRFRLHRDIYDRLISGDPKE